MATIVQFVDAISGSPTVRLDLNSTTSGLMVDVPGVEMSPPSMRRTTGSTMLGEGDPITWAKPENRILRIPLRLVYQASTNAAATTMQNLARELNRPTNLVKLQLDGATSPVFARTYAAPDYTLTMIRFLLATTGQLALEIPAEPYTLGLEESLGSITVNNDPANGTNGLFFDVATPKGDVDTPLYLRTTTNLASTTILLATRRRGTPSSGVWFFQAENGTNGTDTADQADALASGGNEVRTTFVTTTTYANRITATLPSATASAELRGQYRVFVRHQKSATGSVMRGTLRMPGTVDNPEVTIPDSTTYQLVDYGLLQIPFGMKGERDGYGPELGADGVSCSVRLTRVSGTGSLDTDYILLAPADTEIAMVTWPSTPAGPAWVFDGPNDDVYWRGTAGVTHAVSASTAGYPIYVGNSLPYLTPGQTSRVFFAVVDGAITASTVLTASYWPRYLTIRPAST